MTRQDAIRDIENLYGLDTERGQELLIATIERLGLSALTDEAVIHLASRHRLQDERDAQSLVRWT